MAYESLVIYESLVEHRTFVLLGSFVLLDSFVLYDFLSYLRFLKCFLYFSFVDIFILPYLSLFVIWQSEHIFDCIFIYFLFYEYITPIPARKSQLSQEVEELCKSGEKKGSQFIPLSKSFSLCCQYFHKNSCQFRIQITGAKLSCHKNRI